MLGNFSKELVNMLSLKYHVKHILDKNDAIVLDYISEVDVVIIRSPHKLTKEIIQKAKKLKTIIRAGSGIDNIDPTFKNKGINLIRLPLNSNSVAELVFGMMISLSRKIVIGNNAFKEGKWLKNNLIGSELSNKSIGVIGYGNIGRRVAEIAHAFCMKIKVFDRSPGNVYKKDHLVRHNAEILELNELLSVSDFIVLCVPLNNQTRHLINSENIQYAKNNAIIINVARGQVLDIDAIYDYLLSGNLAGVGLDVYDIEPPSTHPIYSLENVLCTPHIGAQTIDAKDRIGKMIISSLEEIENKKR